MARRLTAQAQLEKRRRESLEGGALVDMRIDVVFDDEIMLTVGGKWDRRAEDYVGDASMGIAVHPHAGEIPALRWFKDWMAVHAGRRDDPPAFSMEDAEALEQLAVDEAEVYSALFAGGRRGGKTWTGALICACYAVHFAKSIVWIVNPTDSKHDEVRRYMSALLAPEWVVRETVADGWELANGSAIMLKSAYVGTDPDAIKEGEAHVVWMNEGQKMKERVFVVARGAISDHSGLVLICANPPVEAKDQQWVGDFATDAQNGRRLATYLHFNPLDNPHINRQALMSIRREVDLRTYRIEVLGEFLPPAESVAHNWIRTADGNERPMPKDNDQKWIDVTADFMSEIDMGDDIEHICGIDFQVFPHMGGPVYKLYAPIKERPTRQNVVMWGVDEIVLEGDEEGWCALAVSKGYDPLTTLIIGDGTGEYQHSRRRTADSPPPHWHGRGSFDIIKMGGFPRITRPDLRIKRNNPHVLDRVRAWTAMIEQGNRRRFFMDPDRCPQTCKSIRTWPTVNGIPARRHPATHLGDGATYPVVRLFPRIQREDIRNRVDPKKERKDEVPSLAQSTSFLGPPPNPRARKPGL